MTDEAGAGVPTWAEPDVGPVLVGADELAARVAELGAQITRDYADEPPLLVAVLKGAMLFMSDLCRAIELPGRRRLHGGLVLRQRHEDVAASSGS